MTTAVKKVLLSKYANDYSMIFWSWITKKCILL